MTREEILEGLRLAVSEYEDEQAAELARAAIAAGMDPVEAIDHGLVRGIAEVSERYSCGEAFLPELMLAGKAMRTALAVLQPELLRRKTGRASLGRVVLGTVKADVHDVGKSILATMYEVAGFEVVDLGIDVSTEQFVQAVRERQPQVLGMGAFLSLTVPAQKETIDALTESGLRAGLVVLVGGTATTAEWAARIGADGFADNAVEAVKITRRLLGKDG